MIQSLFNDSLCPPKSGGIYAIINRNNLKIYIGSAIQLQRRRRCHRHDILKGKHHSRYLQRAVEREPSAFEFSVIEVVADASQLIRREQFWISFYKSYLPQNGYNLTSKAGSCAGIKHGQMSQETRLKKSISMRGKPSGMLGKHLSPESRLKISKANKGRKFTLGRKMPEEDKLRRSLLFKGRVFTPEWKAKISAAKKGCNIPDHVWKASVAARKLKAKERKS